MRIEMVTTYEATCSYCGEEWERGGANQNNNRFCDELEKLGWLISGKKRKNNYCSKECEQAAIKEGYESLTDGVSGTA